MKDRASHYMYDLFVAKASDNMAEPPTCIKEWRCIPELNEDRINCIVRLVNGERSIADKNTYIGIVKYEIGSTIDIAFEGAEEGGRYTATDLLSCAMWYERDGKSHYRKTVPADTFAEALFFDSDLCLLSRLTPNYDTDILDEMAYRHGVDMEGRDEAFVVEKINEDLAIMAGMFNEDPMTFAGRNEA